MTPAESNLLAKIITESVTMADFLAVTKSYIALKMFLRSPESTKCLEQFGHTIDFSDSRMGIDDGRATTYKYRVVPHADLYQVFVPDE